MTHSFCSIFRWALVTSSQRSLLTARTTTNADLKLFVHENYICTEPETMGETYLMSETNYFCVFCSVQNLHPCDGQVELVSSHPTEILVSLTILHLACMCYRKNCNFQLSNEGTEEKSWKLLGWILCHFRRPRLHCMSEYSSGQVFHLICYQDHVNRYHLFHEVPATEWPDLRASLIPALYPALHWTRL